MAPHARALSAIVEEDVKAALTAALLLLSACASPILDDPTATPVQYGVRYGRPRDGGSEPIPLPPPPVTAICRDDYFSYSDKRREACVRHGGVRQWVNRPAE
ncbi:MAG: DUF3761 domain-containing protein [Alphaproteobacteria bacterium]|nr:DUF3761 domain-containing protein [Alphaproteobacteria bacterium]